MRITIQVDETLLANQADAVGRAIDVCGKLYLEDLTGVWNMLHSMMDQTEDQEEPEEELSRNDRKVLRLAGEDCP